MGLFKKIPPRPSINYEQKFIEWMLRYDEQFSLIRKYFRKKKWANVTKATIQEIMGDLNTHNNGQALMDHLCVIGEHFQNIMPLIEKRGGVLNSPPEMQAAFIALTTKMTILPYFVKYKYGLSLPIDIPE